MQRNPRMNCEASVSFRFYYDFGREAKVGAIRKKTPSLNYCTEQLSS